MDATTYERDAIKQILQTYWVEAQTSETANRRLSSIWACGRLTTQVAVSKCSVGHIRVHKDDSHCSAPPRVAGQRAQRRPERSVRESFVTAAFRPAHQKSEEIHLANAVSIRRSGNVDEGVCGGCYPGYAIFSRRVPNCQRATADHDGIRAND